METDNKELYYKSLSKYALVGLMRDRGDFKYLYNMTKPELIRRLCEMDKSEVKECKCKCRKFVCGDHTV